MMSTTLFQVCSKADLQFGSFSHFHNRLGFYVSASSSTVGDRKLWVTEKAPTKHLCGEGSAFWLTGTQPWLSAGANEWENLWAISSFPLPVHQERTTYSIFDTRKKSTSPVCRKTKRSHTTIATTLKTPKKRFFSLFHGEIVLSVICVGKRENTHLGAVICRCFLNLNGFLR